MSQGKLHPDNVALPEGEHSILDRLDFFFGDPRRSLAVGAFFRDEVAEFSAAAAGNTTDSDGALRNYNLFKRYGAVVDEHLTDFCAEDGLALESVAEACTAELKRLSGASSAHIFLPYICAALDADEFAYLVCEVNELHDDRSDESDASASEAQSSDELEDEISEGDAERGGA